MFILGFVIISVIIIIKENRKNKKYRSNVLHFHSIFYIFTDFSVMNTLFTKMILFKAFSAPSPCKCGGFFRATWFSILNGHKLASLWAIFQTAILNIYLLNYKIGMMLSDNLWKLTQNLKIIGFVLFSWRTHQPKLLSAACSDSCATSQVMPVWLLASLGEE